MYVTKVVDTLRVWSVASEQCLQTYSAKGAYDAEGTYDIVKVSPHKEMYVETSRVSNMIVTVAHGKVVNTLPRLGRNTCFGPRHVFAVEGTVLVMYGHSMTLVDQKWHRVTNTRTPCFVKKTHCETSKN